LGAACCALTLPGTQGTTRTAAQSATIRPYLCEERTGMKTG
jgi:hypothetical protein